MLEDILVPCAGRPDSANLLRSGDEVLQKVEVKLLWG